MALDNNSYIVNTVSGQIIVPVNTVVPYLDINLIGYGTVNFAQIMTQNIVTIRDEIQSILDGGSTQATFDINTLIANAQASINSQIALVTGNIASTINTNIAQSTYTLTQEINAVQTQSNINKIDIDSIRTILGDSNSGLIQEVTNMNTLIGNQTSGLVQQSNNILNGIASLSTTIGDANSGLTQQVNTNTVNIQNNTLSITNLDATVGGASSGLVLQSINNSTDITSLKTVVGNNTSGLVQQVNTLTNTVTAINSTNVAAILGDNVSGLIYQINTNSSDISTLKTEVQDGNSGLIYNMNNLLSYNLSSFPEVKTVLGDSSTGLVQQVDNNSTSIHNLNTNYGTLNSSLNNLNTDYTNYKTTLSGDLNDINSQMGILTGNFTNLGNLVLASNLTYTGPNSNVYFTSIVLNDMYTITSELRTNGLIDIFNGYFYDSINNKYIEKTKVGDLNLQAWINDPSTVGFNTLVTDIANTVTGNSSFTQVQMNTDNITILNSDNTVPGSVAYSIQSFNDYLMNASTGIITTINADENTIGSTEYKINSALTPAVTTLNAEISTINTNIDTINTSINEDLSNIQLEMVRYTTILPFLQTMFKKINVPGTVTNDDIDTIFNTLLTNINSIIPTSEYLFTFDSTNNLYNISITLPSDFTMDTLMDPNNTPYNIYLYDNAGNADGRLMTLTSGKYTGMFASSLFTSTGTEVPITNPYASGSDCKAQFTVIDSLGNTQIITVPIQGGI